MNKHDHALVVLREELKETEAQAVIRKELMDEWVQLRDYRRLNLVPEGDAGTQARISKEQYVMLRLKILGLKHSIATLERDGAV